MIERFAVPATATLRDAMARIDANGRGIAVVVDERGLLVGLITDGDVRRWLLAGHGVDAPARAVLAAKAAAVPRAPVTAPADARPEALLKLMRDRGVRQVPLLEGNGRVVGVACADDLLRIPPSPLSAVIMAGGFGKRLGPLTASTPKPMLPVAGKPLLEHIVHQLAAAGIEKVVVTTHFEPEKIVGHFGDGERFGMDIQYIHEDTPLGTAGALGFVEGTEDLLVMNGDVLTNVDLRAMREFHREQQAQMTIALQRYETRLPYGVVDLEGPIVRGLREKPVISSFVNAGIYLLGPRARKHIPAGERYDMPDLVAALLANNERVVGFPLYEYWIDIGIRENYEQAQEDARHGRITTQ